VSGTAPDDRELDQLLSETADLRQRYRASSEEPPAALDDAIRAAARREVGTRPRLAGSPFSGSWRVPVSIAAVVVVSATLIVMLVERDAHRLRADATAAKVRAEPERKTIEASGPKVEPRPPESDAAERAKSKESTRTSDRAVSDQLDRRAPRGEVEDRTANASPSGEQEKQAGAAPPPSPEPFPAQAPAAGPAPAKPAPQNTVRGFSQQSPPSAGSAASTLSTPNQPEAAAEARQKAESSKDQAGLRDTPAAAGAVAPQERRERAAAPSAAPAVPAAEEGLAARSLGKKQQGAADASESAAPAWEQDPAAWLKHIDTLRVAGHSDEAKTSFEAFRKRYPDYQLPAGFVVPGS
jgi:hypothetical protein